MSLIKLDNKLIFHFSSIFSPKNEKVHEDVTQIMADDINIRFYANACVSVTLPLDIVITNYMCSLLSK